MSKDISEIRFNSFEAVLHVDSFDADRSMESKSGTYRSSVVTELGTFPVTDFVRTNIISRHHDEVVKGDYLVKAEKLNDELIITGFYSIR